MARRLLAGALGGVACLLVASLCHAECQMDNDCPGDLVCEDAACVAPSSVPAPAPAAAAPLARPRPTTTAPDQARVRWQAAEPPVDAPPTDAPTKPPRGKRHSQAMFVTGIVITSMAPIGMMMSSLGVLCGISGTSSGCDDLIVTGLITTGLLAGVGIPLLVVGAQRDPVATGRIAPWLTPHSAGVGLHFDL